MKEQIELFNSNLLHDNKDIQRHLRIRSRTYEQITIKKEDFSNYSNNGWIVGKENINTLSIRKLKSHLNEFKDRIWSLLAKMGFPILNASTPLNLFSQKDYSEGVEIDVYSSDQETTLVIFTFSEESSTKMGLDEEIKKIVFLKQNCHLFLNTLNSGSKKKIKFILATNNIVLSQASRDVLKIEKIEHFIQDDINYYEQLTERLGQAAKYQLLGRIFKNEEIPQLDNKIPAIKGKMGGYTYYSFSLEPEKLLKIGYILHRTEITSDDDGYQRMVSKGRLREIEAFLNDDENPGFFPNSIIINISTKKENSLSYTLLKGEKHDSNIAEPVILSLPKSYHSAFIIDGQHRLYAYANTNWKYSNSIPVVAFENLPPEKQVELFVQINSKQKPVSKNLLITIMADLMWNSDKPKDALTALKSKILQYLGEKDDSPLYKRIIVGENQRTDMTCISLDYIMTNAFNKSEFFPKYHRGNLVSMGHLWVDPKDGYEAMLQKAYSFFKDLFDYVRERTDSQWNLGNNEGGVVATNIGIFTIVRIVDDILEYLEKYTSLKPILCSTSELASKTFPFLDVVLDLFMTFDLQKIKQIKQMATSANGMENLIREIQKNVRDKFPSFAPPGLDEWLKENTGNHNESSRNITEIIETHIRNFVFDKLKELFHDKWWDEGVPREIQKNAAVTAIDKGNKEPRENFIFLLDYKKIIEKAAVWSIFKDFFADPEFKSGKENQLKWFDTLNEIRNKVSHPGRAKVTTSEAEFLENLRSWLLPLIAEEE